MPLIINKERCQSRAQLYFTDNSFHPLSMLAWPHTLIFFDDLDFLIGAKGEGRERPQITLRSS